jgi:hypothetical protein
MGSRANLAIIENNALELYYSHWAGQTIPHDLFWGLPHALAFIRAQQQVPNDEWLDDVWCEGGCVLNLDERRAIFFGGEDVKYDIPLRRVFLSLFRHTWPSWNIEWAHDEIVDLALAAGIPREKVQAKRERQTVTAPGNIFKPVDGPNCHAVITVLGEQDFQVLRMRWSHEAVLLYGPAVLTEISAKATRNPLQEIVVKDEGDSFPSFGFHVDVPAHNLSLWAARVSLAHLSAINNAWSGWTVDWLRDNYERHQELTDDRIIFEPPSRRVLLTHVSEILLRPTPDLVKSAMDTCATLAREVGPVEINPAVAIHTPSIMPVELRKAILMKIWEAEDLP